jgi:hypothetical protein
VDVGGSFRYWAGGVAADAAAGGVAADSAVVALQAGVDSADSEAVAAGAAELPGVGERASIGGAKE